MRSEILKYKLRFGQEENGGLAEVGLSPVLGAPVPSVGPRADWGSAMRRVWAVLAYWLDRSRQRHRLLSLDDRMLSDIGISRADAEWEYRKWFWQ